MGTQCIGEHFAAGTGCSWKAAAFSRSEDFLSFSLVLPSVSWPKGSRLVDGKRRRREQRADRHCEENGWAWRAKDGEVTGAGLLRGRDYCFKFLECIISLSFEMIVYISL